MACLAEAHSAKAGHQHDHHHRRPIPQVPTADPEVARTWTLVAEKRGGFARRVPYWSML